MSLRHRSAVLAGGASCVAALALMIASTLGLRPRTGSARPRPLRRPRKDRHQLFRVRRWGARSRRGWRRISTLRSPRAPRTPASPWTPLKNPPPFGTPGTMLLESDGTVLVHNEPDNNTTGGTNEWWKLTPDSHGSYIDGTWSQIASMPAGYTPAVFRVGDPARRAHDRRGRRVHRGKRGVDEPGRDLQPGDQHLGLRRTAAGLDEHRGRRERCPGRRHLHAPAAVQDLPHESGSDRR